MKTKIILTIIIAALYFGSLGVWNTVKSPVTGATTAAQLDDTARSFMAAKVVRENFVENTIQIAALVLAAAVWLLPVNKNKNPK